MVSNIQDKNTSLPVDFVTFNWFVTQNEYGHHSYMVGEPANPNVPNALEMVSEINIIDRDLAEVKFENGAFVIVKNLNTYGTIIKSKEDEHSTGQGDT